MTDFCVVDTVQAPILGLSASQELGVVKIILNMNSDNNCFARMHPKLFQGLGCLKTLYHIQIDPSVTPVVSPLKNQPAAIQDRLKRTLNDMETMGVIRKVDEPTEFISYGSESKKLRVCLDPRPLNIVICREYFQLPTLEDITTRLTGACVFKPGAHQPLAGVGLVS